MKIQKPTIDDYKLTPPDFEFALYNGYTWSELDIKYRKWRHSETVRKINEAITKSRSSNNNQNTQ